MCKSALTRLASQCMHLRCALEPLLGASSVSLYRSWCPGFLQGGLGRVREQPPPTEEERQVHAHLAHEQHLDRHAHRRTNLPTVAQTCRLCLKYSPRLCSTNHDANTEDHTLMSPRQQSSARAPFSLMQTIKENMAESKRLQVSDYAPW